MATAQHPKLIRANIALFKGERAETRRLLDEFRAENPANTQDSMVLWLDAQAQNDQDVRISRLYDLIRLVPVNDPYGQMARQILQDEEHYKTKLKRSGKQRTVGILGVPLWKGLLFLIAGGVISFVAVMLFAPPSTPAISDDTDVVVAGDVTASPTAVSFPDRSRALVADSFTARYTQGLLQITAYEDRSERVVTLRDGLPAQPVDGARFFALELVFECRAGICNNPPEAELAVEMSNGDIIELRSDVMIADGEIMSAVALGRATSGWAIFEVPILSTVERLIVTPDSDNVTEPVEPLNIVLPPPT